MEHAMTIIVSIGQRKQDQIKLTINDITDAVEIYNTARAALDGSNRLAAQVVEMVDRGEFEIDA